MNYYNFHAPHYKRYKKAYSIIGFFFLKASREIEDVMVGYEKISLSPGELITCQREICEATGFGRTSVRTIIKYLANNGEIEIFEVNHKYSKFKINIETLRREC